MKTQTRLTVLTTILVTMLLTTSSMAQDKNWSLDDCMQYALDHNVDIKQANLSTNQNAVLTDQAKANRLPSVSASVSQSFGASRSTDSETGKYSSITGKSSTSYSVNSSVTLFNGFKLQKTIKQNQLNFESSKFYAKSIEESVQLSILNAFLEVIYAQEEVANAQKQIEATTEELTLAKERLALGAISRSDYLDIESELATEKLTLANAQSTLTMDKVSLMQLMEFPVANDFDIASPDIDALLGSVQGQGGNATDVYETALKIKPAIKSAELTTESAQLDTDLAKAELLPSLTMSAEVSSGYSSTVDGYNYPSQLGNSVNPALGLSLSIPIFQKKQVKSDIALAKISAESAQLDEVDTRNELRKNIEQACADLVAAQSNYEASQEQYNSINESYSVASEKFKIGSLNSVDFLFEKTDLIEAESQLLQAKFKLVFSNKILDFYKGLPLTL